MSFQFMMCLRIGRAKSSKSSMQLTSSTCQAERPSIECSCFPVACNLTFHLPQHLNLAPVARNLGYFLVTLWRSLTFNHSPSMNSLDTRSITHCAHAFASNEAGIGKPSIG